MQAVVWFFLFKNELQKELFDYPRSNIFLEHAERFSTFISVEKFFEK